MPSVMKSILLFFTEFIALLCVSRFSGLYDSTRQLNQGVEEIRPCQRENYSTPATKLCITPVSSHCPFKTVPHMTQPDVGRGIPWTGVQRMVDRWRQSALPRLRIAVYPRTCRTNGLHAGNIQLPQQSYADNSSSDNTCQAACRVHRALCPLADGSR